MAYEIPRRARLDLMTTGERAIYEVMQEVEKMGAHVLLTETVILLGQAREKLADWVDRDENICSRGVHMLVRDRPPVCADCPDRFRCSWTPP